MPTTEIVPPQLTELQREAYAEADQRILAADLAYLETVATVERLWELEEHEARMTVRYVLKGDESLARVHAALCQRARERALELVAPAKVLHRPPDVSEQLAGRDV